mmetsp:Transcript_22346/g.33306  ORF Transcript_22346/g.33306 Transcript_22346/m.33306 type:complete len:99 (+) Transcript_22346:172-468(+)
MHRVNPAASRLAERIVALLSEKKLALRSELMACGLCTHQLTLEMVPNGQGASHCSIIRQRHLAMEPGIEPCTHKLIVPRASSSVDAPRPLLSLTIHRV